MQLHAADTSWVLVAAALLIALGTAALIVFAFGRRRLRQKHFQALDEARRQCLPILRSILEGQTDYRAGLQSLREFGRRDGPALLEHILPTEDVTPAQAPILLRLCEDLGLIELWQRRLTRASSPTPEGLERLAPLRFVGRARSAQNLGIVGHRASWRILADALNDPSRDVREVAAQSLGLLLAPESFAFLAERLRATALAGSPSLSGRQIKSVLVRFPLEQSAELLPSLQHSDARVRALAADIVRGMVEREAAGGPALDSWHFPPSLASLFLEQLSADANPNVRAHAAAVIARLPDARTVPALLTLLEDSEWFVRLRAVRALAQAQQDVWLEPLARRLTDSSWRVREAAARTLSQWGEAGANLLLQQFLATEDRYGREQIAETLQRDGLMARLLQHYGEEGHERDSRVIDALKRMGKAANISPARDSGRKRETPPGRAAATAQPASLALSAGSRPTAQSSNLPETEGGARRP